MDNNNQRFAFVDLCKVLAMFLVTWAHCAQQLCGNLFPELLISKDSFISFNMAAFMIASGFVMNPLKIRNTPLRVFFHTKVIRLLVPMTVWYLLLIVVIYPKSLDYWTAYWYLSSLFVCLVTIKILSLFLTSQFVLCLFSIIILSIIPLQCFEKTIYMVPFLWVGYALRFVMKCVKLYHVILLTLLYCFLYYFWDVRYSIYLSPFHIWEININSMFSLVYRFLIGVVGGVAFILWIRVGIECGHFQRIISMAKLGKYTLVFYTMSFVLNALLAKVMWHFGFYITTPGLLDIVSFILSVAMMALMYYFQKYLEHNKISCIFLGIVYRKL